MSVRRSEQAQLVFNWRNAGRTHRQIQAELGISHQTLWKIIRSPAYSTLVEQLEATAMEIHSNRELFRSLMGELNNQ